MTKETTHTPVSPKSNDEPSSLAIVSLVLGVVSLAGPGLILGIPAIITASIALKRKLGGRGLSIAGLVTGIISTIFSLLLCLFIIFMIIWGITRPQDFADPQVPSNWGSSQQSPYQGSRT